MNTHSKILGGSNAQRVLSCPASYLEQQRSPISDVESTYAAEGTLLHSCVTNAVQRNLKASHLRSGFALLPFDISDEQNEVVAKALDQLEALLAEHEGDKAWKTVALEKLLPLPSVTGAFGSVDLVLANERVVIVIDWKFGQGVPVHVLYDMPDGSQQLNAQLAFYACAARAGLKRWFKNRKIVVAIIQPRLDPPMSVAETDDDELDGFEEAFAAAVVEALGRDAHREQGEWCRFAPCKATCPLWTAPIFDLAVIDPTKAALQASTKGGMTEYGAFLSRAMHMAELAEVWAAEIRRQAHVFLEDGGKVRDWKLVPKRATRKWVDEVSAISTLLELGAMQEDIFLDPTLKSVAQAEKALQAKSLALPENLWQSVSTGTTLARADDPRPESSHAQVITNLKQALKAL